jgi:uncharacterized protein YodC (DUF2158 family)
MTEKHADPLSTSDPMTTRTRCSATSKRTGVQCGSYVTLGATVCKWHGGKAPQTEAKANERLMKLQAKAIDTFEFLMDKRGEFPSTAYAAARDVMDRTHGKPRETFKHEGLQPAQLVVTNIANAQDMQAIVGTIDHEAGPDDEGGDE